MEPSKNPKVKSLDCIHVLRLGLTPETDDLRNCVNIQTTMLDGREVYKLHCRVAREYTELQFLKVCPNHACGFADGSVYKRLEKTE